MDAFFDIQILNPGSRLPVILSCPPGGDASAAQLAIYLSQELHARAFIGPVASQWPDAGRAICDPTRPASHIHVIAQQEFRRAVQFTFAQHAGSPVVVEVQGMPVQQDHVLEVVARGKDKPAAPGVARLFEELSDRFMVGEITGHLDFSNAQHPVDSMNALRWRSHADEPVERYVRLGIRSDLAEHGPLRRLLVNALGSAVEVRRDMAVPQV